MNPLHLFWIVPLAYVAGGLMGVLVMALAFAASAADRHLGE